MRIALACALLLLTTGAPARAARAGPEASARAADATFDYLHVEANEGSSAGGHVAIRFADDTYHFQHHPGGLLRLQRDDSAAFLHHYARIENRAVHVRRIAVDPDTLERLHRRFADRFVLEEAQHARLAALIAERDLLAALAAGDRPELVVRGARFFARRDGEERSAVEPGVVASAATDDLARAIEERRPGLLDERRRAVEGGLRGLAAHAGAAAADEPEVADPHRLVAPPALLLQRASELAEASLALQVLATRAPLRGDVLRDLRDGELLRLGDGERAALRALGAELRSRALDLAASRRPDWGSALLLTLARLGAVEQSLRRDRLLVLDAYPRDAAWLTPAEVAAESYALPDLLRDAAAELAATRRPLGSGRVPREIEYTALEAAANRYVELVDASTAGAPLRVARGTLVVTGGASVPFPAELVPTSRQDLQHAHDAASARVDAYAAIMHARYGYDLLARNCVSELLHEVADAVAPQDGDDAHAPLDCAGSEAALGGCIDPGARLRFIPFVSADAVDDAWRVVERTEVPSFRTVTLDEMRRRDGDLAVRLRESSVLGSTLYRARDEDSVFLFFTDDLPALRPLLGVLNLVTGLGATAAGLATLPVDDGALLSRGLRGALFSVPELGFVSIRKGTFAWAPRDTTVAIP